MKLSTNDVYQLAIEHYEEIFGYWPHKKFCQLRNSMANLKANISDEEHDIDNREMALETTKVPLYHPKFHKLWSANT